MNHDTFVYQIPDIPRVFTDTLRKDAPYIARKPRDHESLFIVTNGTLLYEKEGRRELVKEGQIGYIARGSVDTSAACDCDAVSYMAVNFCHDRKNPIPTLPFETVCSQGIRFNYESLFSQALSYYLSKTPGYVAICSGLIMQIIGCLYSEYKSLNFDNRKIQSLKVSVEYMKAHFTDSGFEIRKLSQIAGVSEKHFRRVFMEVYGKTPSAFLQEMRINKAEILLAGTSKSITDIAQQCGFTDVYSFSHSFTKITVYAPSKDRAGRL